MNEVPAFRPSGLLPDQLARFLEEQIVFGDLEPGARLVEEKVVQTHGVSRSPVREAFRRLEQSGLVVRTSRKGVSVSPTSKKDLDEVYACRLLLEGLAAEEAAKNRTEHDISLLSACMVRLKRAHEAGDVREYFRSNVEISTQISNCANSVTLSRILASLGNQALRYRYMVYSSFPEMMDVSIEANRMIVEAIAQQNARYARSVTEDVILRSWRSIGEYLQDAPAPEGAPPD